jgi:hypothetical protein
MMNPAVVRVIENLIISIIMFRGVIERITDQMTKQRHKGYNHCYVDFLFSFYFIYIHNINGNSSNTYGFVPVRKSA